MENLQVSLLGLDTTPQITHRRVTDEDLALSDWMGRFGCFSPEPDALRPDPLLNLVTRNLQAVGKHAIETPSCFRC